MSTSIWLVILAIIAGINIILGILKIKDNYIQEGVYSFFISAFAIILLILINFTGPNKNESPKRETHIEQIG